MLRAEWWRAFSVSVEIDQNEPRMMTSGMVETFQSREEPGLSLCPMNGRNLRLG
jgi:hypothetical protein